MHTPAKWRFAILALAPILAYAFLYWTNRVSPWILGIPFFMAWLIFCQFIAWISLIIVYFFDPSNKTSTEITPPLLHDQNLADFSAIKDAP